MSEMPGPLGASSDPVKAHIDISGTLWGYPGPAAAP
jgi:hypothetical protein